MKRFIMPLGFIVLLLICALPAHAQVSVGFKGGVNWGNLAGKDVESSSALARMIGGGFMVVKVSDAVAFQPELLYAQKGAKDTFEGTTMKLKLDYVEVPLLLRLQPTMTQTQIVPHAFVGPAISFKTRCKASVENTSSSATVDCDTQGVDSNIKSLDYGAVFGGGADVAVGRALLVFDVRYNLGLAKIDDSATKADVKNRALAVMAGFRFPLGGLESAIRQF